MNTYTKKGFALGAIIAIIAVLLIAGGVYWSVQKKTANQNIQPTVATSTETANWKTYTNSQYGFSFQYPSNYKISEFNEQIETGSKNSPFLSVRIDPDFSSRNYVKVSLSNGVLTDNFKLNQYCSSSPVTFLGKKSVKNNCSEGGNGSLSYITQSEKNVLLNNFLLSVNLVAQEDLQNNSLEISVSEFEQVLSTFKFTSAMTPSITVLSPNGGETMVVGHTYTLKWVSKNAPKYVDLSFASYGFEGGTFPIVKNVPNNGTYTFTVPADLAPASVNEYQFVVYALTGESDISDMSDNYFTITN